MTRLRIAMTSSAHAQPSRPPAAARTLCGLALALLALLAPAAGARAAVTTFGSPLGVAATKDTALNLNYVGTKFAYGTGIVHISHDGADTALWNSTLPGGATAAAPAGGQITSVRLEGCADPALGGPAPLTQIHFQALTPIAGGGAHVDVTTQPFTIPTCGAGGATPRTVTTYQPLNFCVGRGDIVDFNDEGGFDPHYYPSGVQYRVIGAVAAATMDSYIADNGTNNGADLAPTDLAASHGFASNPHEELMLQSTLATGADATPLCPGGLYGEPGMPGGKPALAFGQANIGADHQGVVPIAVYCDLLGRPCAGTIELQAGGATIGRAPLVAPTGQVTIVRLHMSSATMAELRSRGPIPVLGIAALSDAASVTHAMHLRL